MKKWGFLWVLLLCALAVSGAAEGVYDEIAMDDTRETLAQRYEIAAVDGGVLVAEEVRVTFFASGRLHVKCREYAAPIAAAVVPAQLPEPAQLTVAIPRADVEALCGTPGAELMSVVSDDADNAEWQRVFVWADDEGNMMQAMFDDSDALIHAVYTKPLPERQDLTEETSNE